MNSLNVKAQFQIGQFRSLKQIFYKFKANLTLKGQGQGQHFPNSTEIFRCFIKSSSSKVKFEVVQCLTVKIMILEV